MGFARAARPKRNDVLAPLDPFAPSQFQHLDLVEARDRLEVEAIQTFDRRELRRLDPTLDHAPFAVDHLQFHQPAKELDMVQLLGGALPGQLLVFPQEGRQPQRLEVMRQKQFGGVGHDAASDTRHM